MKYAILELGDHKMIVTANNDDTIPLNSKVVMELREVTEPIRLLVKRANQSRDTQSATP